MSELVFIFYFFKSSWRLEAREQERPERSETQPQKLRHLLSVSNGPKVVSVVP